MIVCGYNAPRFIGDAVKIIYRAVNVRDYIVLFV